MLDLTESMHHSCRQLERLFGVNPQYIRERSPGWRKLRENPDVEAHLVGYNG